VQIKPGKQNLEIYYTGLSFSRPEQVKFKYQLVGQDEDWVDAGTRRTAYYSYLPPGAYIFKVIAENGDGVWSEQAATRRIIATFPEAHILMVTQYDDTELRAAAGEAGVCGYVLKENLLDMQRLLQSPLA